MKLKKKKSTTVKDYILKALHIKLVPIMYLVCEMFKPDGTAALICMPMSLFDQLLATEPDLTLWLYVRPMLFLDKAGGFTVVVTVRRETNGKPEVLGQYVASKGSEFDRLLRQLYIKLMGEQPNWKWAVLNSPSGKEIIKDTGRKLAQKILTTPNAFDIDVDIYIPQEDGWEPFKVPSGNSVMGVEGPSHETVFVFAGDKRINPYGVPKYEH